MVTGPDGQGDAAEMVLGIGAVVAVPVVVTDEATLGLAARIDVMATAATAPILRTERIMAPTVVTVVAGSDVRAPDDHEDLTAIRSTCILCAWGRREFAAGSPATDPTWDHGFEIEHGRHDRKGLTWVA
jgi:hypothetical protein